MAVTKVLNVEIKDNALDVSKDIDKLNKSGENLEQTFKDVNATFEDVYGELKPLTGRLGEAEDRLYELALAGKQNTQEYKELLKATANYRQVQIRTDLVVDTAARTLSEKLVLSLEGAASGFALVQGSMGLFGDESEEVQRAMLKVQSAMALAQGIEGVRAALPLFKSFGGVVKNAVVGAFTTLRGAIISTGIGALVVALGMAADAMGLFGSATEDAAEANKKLADSISKNTSEIERRIGRTLKQQQLLREEAEAYGATERELFEMRKKEIDLEEELRMKQYNLNLARIDKLKNKRGEEVKTEVENLRKQNSALYDSLFNRIQGENEYDLKRRELELEYTKFVNNELDQQEKKADEKKQKDIDRAKERARQLEEIERQRILNIQQLEQDFLAELEGAESEYFDSLLSEQEQEVRVVEDKYFNLLTKAQEYNANLTEEEQAKRINTVTLEEARLKEIADIQDKYRKEATDKEKEAAQEVADAKKDIQDAQIANVEKGISLLSQLAGDSRELQALSIAAENAVGIAKIIISTQAANAAAKLKYAAIPGGLALAAAEITANKVSAGIGIAASAAAAAKGIASLKQSVPISTGGSLGGGGGTPSATQQLASPNFDVVGASGVSQAESLAPVKAYVVSGDVTTAQALDRNRINNATF